MKKTSPLFLRVALSAALAACLTAPVVVRAQMDTFDSYTTINDLTAAGWVLSKMATGSVSTTFPAMDSGKGLHIAASPVLGQSPAVAIWYRTNEYTDFYLAADFVNWANTNQTMALLARGPVVGSVFDDPGDAVGYLAQYNVAHNGDAPTDPRQGQLWISVLYPQFTMAQQLAIGDLTLDPGRSYRFVFTGVGFHFKVQVYDLLDLTRPLLQLEAEDVEHTYPKGFCGLMSLSLNDEWGFSDVTFDNCQIGATDPNPPTVPVPALAHPVTGTPTIITRVPGVRFMNCYAPSGGISFTASTYTTNVINASATKLRLNGVDVSTQLALSLNSPTISGSLPGSALNSLTFYSAQIEVQDVAGLRKSTNTFWFDTFSDAYLSSTGVKIIEAEEYNYGNGVHQPDPIAVSGPDLDGNIVAGNGVGYFDLLGIEGVDFHDSQTMPEPPWVGEFRQSNPVGLSQGMFPEIEDWNDPWGETRYTDQVRNKYATNNMLEFVVHRTQPDEWLNYTREFEGGNYNAYLRVASLGSSTVLLDRVTSRPDLPNQSKTNLGKFTIPNQFARYHYRYIPLVDNSGSPVVLNLAGTTTLRLTMAGAPGQDNNKLAINYVLFVPLTGTLSLLSSPTIAGPYTQEFAANVDAGSRTITVPASGAARFYRLSSGTALTIRDFSVSGGIVTMKY